MVLIIIFYIIMMAVAYKTLARRKRLDHDWLEDDLQMNIFTKPVSILVPAYNEELGIIESLHSLITLRYPETEIIVIDDGSKDRTSETVIEAFQMEESSRRPLSSLASRKVTGVYQSQMHPKVFLIKKENGGKADALNAGINFARYPYFCSIDGDSILDRNSLLRVMLPIIASDGKVVAAGGNVRIANGNDIHYGAMEQRALGNHPMVLMQIVEYLRAFMLGRIFFSRFNMVLIVSGAFSIFSKRIVIDVGGYSTDIIGEDMELVVKVHGWIREKGEDERIQFVPDPVCWTEAPTSAKVLRRQRRRWAQGLFESLWRHKYMTLNPKYGRIGFIAFPYFWLFEAFGALVEFAGYAYIIVALLTGTLNTEFALLLLLTFVVYGSIFSMLSLMIESWTTHNNARPKSIFKLVLLSLSETFWYRPMMIIFRMEGMVRFILKKQEWGNMERKGLGRRI
jgi:cellulose synthase/poly-beta-1,6-N-acetylglucosamine synthase-like glycosyltransferase